MADVSNDAIKLLDRGEFSNAVDVQEKRLTRNIRIASVSSAVFWIIWLIVTGIFHGEISFPIICIVMCGYLGELTLCFRDPARLLCPHCAYPLSYVFDWKTGGAPWRSRSMHYLLASGRCPYCRKDIFQNTTQSQLTFSAKELQDGKSYGVMPEIVLFIPLFGMFLMLTGLATPESEMPLSSPFVSFRIAFIELLISLWVLLDSFDRKHAPSLPCPVCHRDLNKGSLRAIARETGGCGYCGARIVADFQNRIVRMQLDSSSYGVAAKKDELRSFQER